MTKTKQVAHTYVEEHRGLVPTFITTCLLLIIMFMVFIYCLVSYCGDE